MLHNIILVVHVIIAASVVTLVLLQQGKGADVGAAFGSGASSTVFGSRGSGSFLTRLTGILATLFFVTSLSLAYLASQPKTSQSVLDAAPVTTTVESAPGVADETGAGESDVPVADDTVQEQATGAERRPADSDVPVTD